MQDIIATFIFFFAVIDPIGSVPVFIAVTSGYDARTKRQIALQATAIATLILLFFLVAGEVILNAMDIPLAAFEIAGGIILFLFALTMIFGESKPEEEIKLADKAGETAVFPLAVPSIASPGAMLAAVLMTENNRFSAWEQAETALIMLAVLVIVLVLLLASNGIQRLIGASGASIISRVMGMILASLAVASVLGGITTYFVL